MRNEPVIALLVIAIVASAGAGYLVGVSNQRPSTSGSSSTATTTPTCDIALRGSVLYVKVSLDGARTPVTSATVDAVPVETCNGVNTTIPIIMQPTVNATGVATLDASYDTFYSVVVHYGTRSYPFMAFVQNSLATCASLSVPSGNLSITSC
jgi:hypothetical protein